MNSSSHRNPDKIPAQANNYERRKIMNEQIRRLKKSPDISKMASIEIPQLRIIYYCKPSKCEAKILELNKKYSDYKLIIKNPIK